MTFPRPKDAGCKGDGREETDHVQKFMGMVQAEGGGIWTRGRYAVADTIHVLDGSEIFGAGAHSSILCKHGSMPDRPLLLNEHAAYSGPPVLIDVLWHRMGFEGLPNAKVSQALTTYISASGFGFDRCRWGHHRNSLWGAGNTQGAEFNHCEFHDAGSRDNPTGDPLLFEGGAAMAFVCGPNGEGNSGMTLDHLFIHDCEWTGLAANGDGGFDDFSVISPRIWRVKEAGVFGGPRRGTFSNVDIRDVTRKAFSMHGFEIGGEYVDIIGGQIARCGGACVYLTDMNQVKVIGLTLSRPMTSMQGAAGSCGAITIRAFDPKWHMDQITVTDNVIEAGDTGTYGVTVYRWGGNAINNLSVRRNNYGLAATWRGKKTVLVEPAALGVNCTIDGDQE